MDSNMKNSLEELQTLLKQDTKFLPFKEFFEDDLLLQFIRGKKFDVNKAYQCLQNYIDTRTVRFVDFTMRLRPSATPLINEGMLGILKGRDNEGRIVLIDKIRQWDVSRFDVDHGLRSWVLLSEEILRTLSESCSNGVVAILDFHDYTFSQAKLLTPQAVRKGYNLIVNSMPIRASGVHFLNHGPVVNLLVAGVKTFLKPKQKNRIHTHPSSTSLHQYIPPSILPKGYGGTLTEEEAFDDEFLQNIFTREDFYEQFAQKVKLTYQQDRRS